MAILTESIKEGWFKDIQIKVDIINDRINELLVKIQVNDPGESLTLNKHRLKDWQNDRTKWSEFKDNLKIKPIGEKITIKEFFFMCYGTSKNFMTPDILKRGLINNNTFYEISAGTDFNHNPITGVSIEILKPSGEIDRHDDKSKLFHGDQSVTDCYEYVRELKKQ